MSSSSLILAISLSALILICEGCTPVPFGPYEGTGRVMYRVPSSMRNYDSFGRCCICCNGGTYIHEQVPAGRGYTTSCACHVYNYCDRARRIPDVPTRPAPVTTPSPALTACRSPTGDSCSWYRDCLNRFIPCPQSSSDEYALNYGNNYCTKYENNLSKFSSKAQKWIGKVKKCLQLALKQYIGNDISCGNLKVEAFDSHTKCYVDSGFCELPLSDYVEITKLVGNALIPFSGGAWRTSLNGGSTLISCAARYASALGEEFSDTVSDLIG